MGFIGGLLGGGSGASFQAQSAPILNTVTANDVGGANWQAQNALGQQQAFVNALGANGAQGLGAQNQLIAQLQQQAAGGGPNPALAQLNQTTGQNVANQAALMAGQRGTGANAGLLARQAAQQGAATQQQAVGQGATLAAQQQLSAQQQLANQANQQVSQQGAGVSGLNSAAQGEQGQILGALGQQNSANVSNTGNMNSANASIAGQNASSQGGLFGGLLGGLGTAATSLLGPAAKVAGAAAIYNGGTIQGYADGGTAWSDRWNAMAKGFSGNASTPPPPPPPPSTGYADGGTADADTPQSFAGKFLSGFNSFQQQTQPSSFGNMGQANGSQNAMRMAGNSLGSALGAGIGSLFSKNQAPVAEQAGDITQGNALPGGGFGAENLGSPGALNFGGENMAAPPFANAPMGPSADFGTAGIGQAHGGMAGDQRGKRPLAQGDNPKNDVVPAVLSPGEIVIPRSILQSNDPIGGAAAFVKQELAKHGRPKNHFVNGGTAVPDGPASIDASVGDTASDPQVTAADSNTAAQIDPDLTAKRALYNQEVLGGSGPSMVNNKPQFTFGQDGAPPQNFDVGAWNRAESRFNDQKAINEKAQSQSQADSFAQVQAENKARVAAGLPTIPMASNDPDAGGQAAASAAGPTKIGSELTGGTSGNQMNDPYGFGASNEAFMKGFGLQQSGIGKEAAAEDLAARGQSDVMGNAATQLQQIQEEGQKNYQTNLDQTHKLMDDYAAQKIDPNRLLSSMGTGQKITTAIGLILGGMGGGLTHQANPAMAYLQSAIDNDIRGQQAQLGQKENLISMNMKQGQNLQEATENARNQLMALTSVQLKQAGLKYAGSAAQARAEQASGQLYQQASQNIGNNAMRAAWAKASASGQQSPNLPAYLDPALDRRVETSGQVFHAPDKDTADKIRPQLAALDDLQSVAARVDAFNKNVGTTYNPLSKNSGVADSLNRETEAAIAKVQASGGQIGRLVDKFQDMAPKAGAFATSREAGKLQQMNSFVAANRAGLIRNSLNSGPAFGK